MAKTIVNPEFKKLDRKTTVHKTYPTTACFAVKLPMKPGMNLEEQGNGFNMVSSSTIPC